MIFTIPLQSCSTLGDSCTDDSVGEEERGSQDRFGFRKDCHRRPCQELLQIPFDGGGGRRRLRKLEFSECFPSRSVGGRRTGSGIRDATFMASLLFSQQEKEKEEGLPDARCPSVPTLFFLFPPQPLISANPPSP